MSAKTDQSGAIAAALDCMTTMTGEIPYSLLTVDRLNTINLARAEWAEISARIEAKDKAIDGLLEALYEANGYDDLLVMANTCGWADKWLNPACAAARAARAKAGA